MAGMTTGELISNTLRFRLNIGSDTVANDQNLRDRSRFEAQIRAKMIWDLAPHWFRLKSGGTMSLAAQGTECDAPSDFSHTGEEMNITISGFPFYSLDWLAPDLFMQNRRVLGLGNISGRPLNYTLQEQTSVGLPQFQIWPTADIAYTLIVDNYVSVVPDLVDRPGAPTVAAGAAGLLTGTYSWLVTFVTAAGETEAGVTSTLIALAAQQGSLTGIPVSPCRTVTSRKIYRTVAGGSAYKLAGTIADNTTTTYSDNLVDGSLGVAPPLPAASNTGLERFPADSLEKLFVEGLRASLATTQGDFRDVKFEEKWYKEVIRFWAEYKQGNNEPMAMPRYGTVISNSGGFGGRYR